MFDQVIISCLFLWLLGSLIFTDWPASWIFVSAMLASYFLGLVDTTEVLSKASNTGLITLLLLLLVSIGLEKLSWLTRLSGRLVWLAGQACLAELCGLARGWGPYHGIGGRRAQSRGLDHIYIYIYKRNLRNG